MISKAHRAFFFFRRGSTSFSLSLFYVVLDFERALRAVLLKKKKKTAFKTINDSCACLNWTVMSVRLCVYVCFTATTAALLHNREELQEHILSLFRKNTNKQPSKQTTATEKRYTFFPFLFSQHLRLLIFFCSNTVTPQTEQSGSTASDKSQIYK